MGGGGPRPCPNGLIPSKFGLLFGGNSGREKLTWAVFLNLGFFPHLQRQRPPPGCQRRLGEGAGVGEGGRGGGCHFGGQGGGMENPLLLAGATKVGGLCRGSHLAGHVFVLRTERGGDGWGEMLPKECLGGRGQKTLVKRGVGLGRGGGGEP